MITEPQKPIVRTWGITSDAEALFRSTDPTHEWLFSLPAESLRQYAGQWLAAKDCRIIAQADTLEALLTRLGDEDPHSVVMRRVDKPGWTIRI